MRKWIALGVACFLLSIGIPIGYATWYVAQYAQHACTALNIIVDNRPAHPTRTQRNFYDGLELWAREDGC